MPRSAAQSPPTFSGRSSYKNLRDAGFFTGDFVAVTYYSLNYKDASSTAAITAINKVLADVTKRFDGKVADGFTAFARVAAEIRGRLLRGRLADPPQSDYL